MISNKLGNTGIELSAMGLGTWAIGGGGYSLGWGSQDDKDSIDTIRCAVELGINWIDTAPVYGDGHSERIMGHALKGVGKEVFISTKCGLFMDDKKVNLTFNLDNKSIRDELECSLKNLGVDVIDLYQLHSPFPEEKLEDAWKLLGDFKKEGKIRFAGISNCTQQHLEKIQPIHPIDFIQPQYSMLERAIENDLLPYCKNNNIGIIAFSPMYRGLLTGKFTKERAENLPKDDNRLSLENFREPYLSANLQLVEKLKAIAAKYNHTAAHLAIAWVLRRPEVTSSIVGARTPGQITQTATAGDWTLSDLLTTEIDAILDSHFTALKELKEKEEGKE